MRCSNVERGCGWEGTVGTLVDHVTKCGFTMVPCPNGCKDADEVIIKYFRKELKEHVSSECPGREYQCQDCGLKDKYRVITGPHEDECEKKMVSCVNKQCDSVLERGCVQEHVRLSCNYTEVSCEYVSVGCGEKRIRLEMKAHEKDHEHHLSLATKKITELNRRVLKLENLPLLSNQGLQVTFMVSEYSYKKRNDCTHDSEPFLSSPTGYKMCLVVYANGEGDGEGSHLSVYLQTLHGPHDDNLDWPLKGTFIIELLNQLEDKNHHRMTLEFSDHQNINKPSGNAWGFHTFIKQSDLNFNSSKNTQYLKDDKLYIRVISKVASSRKPWLNYTHK